MGLLVDYKEDLTCFPSWGTSRKGIQESDSSLKATLKTS